MTGTGGGIEKKKRDDRKRADLSSVGGLEFQKYSLKLDSPFWIDLAGLNEEPLVEDLL